MSDVKPPRPQGAVYFHYNPMSPPVWDLAPFNIHVYVYQDVTVALQAMKYWIGRIQAKRAKERRSRLSGEWLFYRGQTEITQRLLPSRLRGPRTPPAPRMRYVIDAPLEVREREGDWREEDSAFRSAEDSLAEFPPGCLQERDQEELDAIQAARGKATIAALDEFRQRAAVRHYDGVPSSLLDMTTDPDVAAFFATGGGRSILREQYGMLWAIDLNFLADILSLEVVPIAGGWKISLGDQRERWGVNRQFFDERGWPPVKFEIVAVDLPLPRPQAQKARFLSLQSMDGKPLPAEAELIWWSLFERWSYPTAFIQTGTVYENQSSGIKASALLPKHDPFVKSVGRRGN